MYVYGKSAAGYKVKDALKKGDIWQIGVEIGVNWRTIDLLCCFSFLASRWRCDRAARSHCHREARNEKRETRNEKSDGAVTPPPRDEK